MTRAPEFRIVPIGDLHAHEEVEEEKVDELARELATGAPVRHPIWVAAGSLVVLNGHHRFRALERLGARRVPVYLIDYDDPAVLLDRWYPGPTLTKAEVVRRGLAGKLFPPKTTRHTIGIDLPEHPVPLAELLALEAPGAAPERRGRARSRRASLRSAVAASTGHR